MYICMASRLHQGLLQRLGSSLRAAATAGADACHCSTSYSGPGPLRPAGWSSSTLTTRSCPALPPSATENASSLQRGFACHASGSQGLLLPGAQWHHGAAMYAPALQQALQGACARQPGAGAQRTITTKTWRRLKMKKHKIRKRRRANRHKSK